MRTIYFLLQKEFLQIFRDKIMLTVIFLIPVIELILLSYAATFELQNTPFHLVDFDHSKASRQLIQSFEASEYFTLTGRSSSVEKGTEQMLDGQAQMVIVIPPDFEKNIRIGEPAKVQFLINAVNNSTAGLMQGYSRAILMQFNRSLKADYNAVNAGGTVSQIKVNASSWYNSNLDYVIYMVPGIIIVLMTVTALVISVTNIVREKEIGTIEQINVTPIKRYQFIVGKMIPTFIIAMTTLSIGLILAYFWFEVPFRGNVLLIYAIAAIYLLVIQALGLLVSTQAQTQQQAMFINFFLIMVFMLLGGIFTPIASMPDWAQLVTRANPIAYFTEASRMVLLKGAGWGDIQYAAGSLALMAVILLPITIYSYRKRSA